MQVTALAEALVGARRSDGTVSLRDLRERLSRAGLSEFVHVVASLALRATSRRLDGPASDKHVWF
jgi:hypothetical protein